MALYPNLHPFRFWCQKILPAVYDDSLSYYELLCKVIHYINEDRDVLNTHAEAIEELFAIAGEDYEGLDDILDKWTVDNWEMYSHPGTESFVLWYSTSTGSIEWEDYFEPYIDHSANSTDYDPEFNDSTNSNSYVNIRYFPKINLMIIDAKIIWKKVDGTTIEDKMLADERFLRMVPANLETYDPADFPYPNGAQTAAECRNSYYWFPLFHFKKPIGWGTSAPTLAGQIEHLFTSYSYDTQFYQVINRGETPKQYDHRPIALWSKLESNTNGQIQLYGDGNFLFRRQLGSFWNGGAADSGINSYIYTSLFVTPNGFLSQYQNKTGEQINEEAINWGKEHQGFFYYGAVGNARLDLVPDITYNGQPYPRTDCSALMWLLYYRGAGIPIGSAAPGREIMLGEFVTFAKGGYWDSNKQVYVPGEVLDLSKMKPGDLIGYQPVSYGDISHIPVTYNSLGEITSGVGRSVHDNYYPPHNMGCRINYTHHNPFFEKLVDISTRDFTHVAMYLGDNQLMEISGSSIFGMYFPEGHRQYGDVSPICGEGNIYGNPETYVNYAGETKPFNITLLSENFDPHLGPYIFEGADIKGKDIMTSSVSDKSQHVITSMDRYVVRLFPDNIFWRSK